jgi:hypothetical protein
MTLLLAGKNEFHHRRYRLCRFGDHALLVCGETVDGKLVHVSSLIGFLPRYVSFVLGQCVGDGEPGRFRADEHVVRR